MSYLIVIAHPDDEVLGMGGTIHTLTSKGEEVNVCILSGNVTARKHRPTDSELNADMFEAMEKLGVNQIYVGEFPNIEFNNVPHLKVVQFIEEVIVKTNANVIFTHHPADVNNDHLHTSLACQAAARLFQRRTDIKPLEALYYMEVSSSTEWGINTSMNAFRPNTFIEIGNEGLDVKLDALGCYRGVKRAYPHPRSDEAIKGLALHRGSQAGLNYAEAYECVFKRNII